MLNVTFVTSKNWKRQEAAAILGMPDLRNFKIDLPELQSMDLQDIVLPKARAAFEQIGTPVLVDDVALRLHALHDMPGPFVRFWEERDLYPLTLELMKLQGNYRALVQCAVGYKDTKHELFVIAEVPGRLVPRTEGEGVGFDFHFIPDGYDQTYAQMGLAKKSTLSHRYLAFTLMRDKLRELGLL